MKDNQHYIPQLLLKGFTAEEKPKMTFRYKAGERTREKSIRKIASENNFYKTEDDDNSVDENYTQFENHELKNVIEELRTNQPIGQILDHDLKISAAVLHLWSRSRHIREMFSNPLEQLLTESGSIFGSSEGLKKLFVDSPSSKTEDALYNRFVEKLVENYPEAKHAVLDKAKTLALMKVTLSNNPKIFEDMAEQTLATLSTMRDWIEPTAKSEHISLLKSEDVKNNARFEGFNWFIVEDCKNRFVFPDCVLMSYDTKEGFFPLLLSTGTSLTTALPLTASRLLVGTKNIKCPEINDQHFPQIGRCAFEFFISPTRFKMLEMEKAFIGKMYEDFSGDVVTSALSKYR